MKTIAVLLTCHNRKEKTITCLRNLYTALAVDNGGFSIAIYITDDGCTDGTSEAVLNEFSAMDITVLQGSGSLYWAGGMRYSWTAALKKDFDGYILINDDTYVYNNVFSDMRIANDYSIKQFGIEGVYIGSTESSNHKNSITYGGSNFLNKWKLNEQRVIPNGIFPQECQVGNANIMFVSKNVVKKIGILSSSYAHAAADYDYTLMAKNLKLPVLVTSNICGSCENDHPVDFHSFKHKSLSQRKKFAYSPNGFHFNDYIEFNKRNFFYRVPLVFFICWFRILFPSFYIKIFSDLK
jgi:GT2 family glycosyltransferase